MQQGSGSTLEILAGMLPVELSPCQVTRLSIVASVMDFHQALDVMIISLPALHVP